MTLRILNDDARCLRPQDCRIRSFAGSALCSSCRDIVGHAHYGPKPYAPPAGLEGLYAELKGKLGQREARAAIADHAKRKGAG